MRTRKSIAKQFKATWPGGVEQPIQGVHDSEVQTWLGLHSSRVGKATLNDSQLRLLQNSGLVGLLYPTGGPS